MTIANLYNTFSVYLPPNSGGGSEYVPLTTKTWNWLTSTSKTGGQWSIPNGNPNTDNAEIADTDKSKVEWQDVYYNSP